MSMLFNLPVESDAIAIELIMAIEPDGSLKKVEIYPTSDELDDSKWEAHASNFITGVITSAFSKKTRPLLHQVNILPDRQ